jgi:hypothetical protein
VGEGRSIGAREGPGTLAEPKAAQARQIEVCVTKHSKRERAQRATESGRVKEIEAAWIASVPNEVARAFAESVAAARARGPEAPRPDMAPGTAPNPPRPGHEPKPPKVAERGRRGR